MVWSEPMISLAPRFGISDVGLKKRCVRLRVPTPNRGYWEKLSAGKNPKKLNLEEFVEPTKRQKAPLRAFTPPMANHTLRNPHPVVLAVKSEKRESIQGIVGLKRAWGLGTSIHTTDTHFRRCCWILECVLRRALELGAELEIDPDSQTAVQFRVEGELAHIYIREKLRRVDNGVGDPKDWLYKRYTFEPNGQICFGIVFPKIRDREFEDRITKPLDSRIDEIAVAIVEGLKESAAIRELRRLESIHAEENRREKERLRQEREAEQARVDELERQAEGLLKSHQIIKLVDSVELRIKELPTDGLSIDRAEQWLAWARKQAARLNPVEEILRKLTNAPSD